MSMPLLKDGHQQVAKYEHLTGQKINHWLVGKRVANVNGSITYECECDCELHTTRNVKARELVSGRSKSCGKGGHRKGFYNKRFNTYEIEGNTVKIFYKNYICLIDEEDLERVKCCHWFAHKDYQGDIRWESTKCGLLHRFVIQASPNVLVDHVNGDTNDNRKTNLRTATHSNNSCNVKISSNNSSGFTGVDINNDSYINYQGNRYKLGRYPTLKEAVYARYYAETLLHKNFSYSLSRNIDKPTKPINHKQIEEKVINKLRKKGLVE